METTKATFPCSQGALFATDDLIINRLREHLTDFSTFRSIYSDSYCNLLAEKNAAARALPNDQMRSLGHETLRDELITLGTSCRSNFKKLKRYITYSVPASQLKSNLDAAGWQHYEEAGNDNWVALMDMMDMGLLYINDRSVQLQANGNMPISFRDVFAESAATFNTTYLLFEEAQQDARAGTFAKLELCNEIYSLISDVSKDSAVIYENNAVLRDQFTFSTVCGLVAPAGASGAVITVMNAETDMPMVATVSVQGSSKNGTTNSATGRCDFTQLAAAETVFVIDANGFVSQSITRSLNAGATSYIAVDMEPLVATQQRMPVPENGLTQIEGSGGAAQAVGSGSEQAVVNS